MMVRAEVPIPYAPVSSEWWFHYNFEPRLATCCLVESSSTFSEESSEGLMLDIPLAPLQIQLRYRLYFPWSQGRGMAEETRVG